MTDSRTNFLYLADILPIKFPDFYLRFDKALTEHNIDCDLLPHTKDIWAVDYMPIQTGEERFVKFVYDPSYLMFKKYQNTRVEFRKLFLSHQRGILRWRSE